MSNTEEGAAPESQKPVISTPATPKSRVESIFSELEIMAMQKGRDGVDLSKFTPAQIDKVLGIAEKNEDNGFAYHTQRMGIKERIALSKINASVITHRTTRLIIMAVIIVLFATTLIVLLLKDKYFLTWLAFITGLLGGFGIGRTSSPTNKGAKSDKKESETE